MEVCLTVHLSLLKTSPCSLVTHMNFVEIFVMFLVILSMNNYIICDAYHSITANEDPVHHPLEDVLCTGLAQGEADKSVPSPWCVEGCKQ